MRTAAGSIRRLTRHFLSGLTDNDLIAPGEDLHATIAGVLAACLMVSAGVGLMFLGKYNSVALNVHGYMKPVPVQTLADKMAMALDDKTLLLGGAMTIMALLAVVFWDSLRVDERDLAVLGTLPVRPATVLLSKMLAVGVAAAVVALALNVLPAIFFPMVVLAKARVGFTELARWMAAYAVAAVAACAFSFLAVASLRTLADFLLPRRARALLSIAQFLLVLALLSLLLALPLLASKARGAVESASATLAWCPPLWFLGIEEVLIGRTEPVFSRLAALGGWALALSAVAVGVLQFIALGDKMHRSAPGGGSPASVIGRLVEASVGRVASLVASDGRARASFLFAARTLTRSPRHRLYLAASLGLGLAISGATIGAAAGGIHIGRSPLDPTTMALAAQFNLVFFLVVGLRLSAAIPSDLDAGWVFRYHATPALERYLAGTRAAIFCLAVLPLLVLLAPLHFLLWGGYAALVHFAFGVVTALGMLEVVFSGYTRLPFVSAFTPGRTLLSLRFPLHVLAYLLLVYATPQVERLFIERAGMFFAWVALFAVVVWRIVTSQSARVTHDRLPSFDDNGGEVQLLALETATGGLRRDADAAPGVNWTRATSGPVASGLLFSAAAAREPMDPAGGRATTPQGVILRVWRTVASASGQLRQEMRFALRRLYSQPGFALFAVLTLALGIGVTAAIYSVLYSTILKPLDVPEADRIVNIYHADPRLGGSRQYIGLSLPDFEDLARSQQVFSDLCAHAPFPHVAIVNGIGEKAVGEAVSGGYFSVLRMTPVLGRLLGPSDEAPGAPPVAVIGELLWRRRFEGSRSVLGQRIRVAGEDLEIVGVVPTSFRGVELPNLAPTSVWVPLSLAGALGAAVDRDDPESRWLVAKGRLAPGRSLEDARAAVEMIGKRLDAERPIGRHLRPELRSPPAVRRSWAALSASDRLVNEQADPKMRRLAGMTMLAIGLVLAVACTNLANLVLARGTARRREIAVRYALGASRWQVVCAQLVESAVLAVLGGAAALAATRLLATWGVGATLRLGSWASVDLRPVFDVPAVLVALASTLLSLVVFGLLPAIRLSGLDLRAAIGGEASGTAGTSWRGRRLLIAAQVAVSVALVAIASLSVRQIVQAARTDTGVDLDRLAMVRLDFSSVGWPEDRARAAVSAIAREIGRRPGIERVAVASGLPVGTSSWLSGRLATPDQPFAEPAYYGQPVGLIAGTPAVFATFGVTVVDGRPFDERDVSAGGHVIVLSEVAARTLFGTTRAVNREVLRRVQAPDGGPAPPETLTVIGIASDTDSGRAGSRKQGVAYVPLAQLYVPRLAVVVRTATRDTHAGQAAETRRAGAALEAVVRRLYPELGIVDAGTGPALGGIENVAFEVMAGVTGVLGLLSLLLAMAGLYGVLSYAVAQRTHEMGVRLALGATASRIVGLVLGDGLRPVVEGLVVGFVIADLSSMAVRPVFSEPLPAIDPVLLAVLPLPFLAAAVVACYLPARRAARVEPTAALREN